MSLEPRPPTILWINGAFGSGKTSLARHLVDRLPDAMLYDPELAGFLLRIVVPPADSGDFQDLPIWRDLAADIALLLRRHYRRRLVVPMTLARTEYRQEILGRLEGAGERVMHFFLDVSEAELIRRIEAQVMDPDDPVHDAGVRAWRRGQVARCLEARTSLAPDTVLLAADGLSVDELGRRVLQAVAAAETAGPPG